jgi:erythromycin esterase
MVRAAVGRHIICALVAAMLAVGCLVEPAVPTETLPNDDITQWFAAKALSINTTTPGVNDVDLISLDGMATATGRLIGIGEATHGTRQFFELKHRILQSLVERRANILAFAIEASMPDAMAIDDYVRQGTGDPAKALSHLYFWTWRTQEVLDLIRWLREYNAPRPLAERIGFFGVDFQYPGGAVRRIGNWIPTSFATLRSQVNDAYGCIMPYINDDQGVFARDLAKETAAIRNLCLAGARTALDAITARATELRAALGDDSYDMHARLAVSVVQWASRAAGIGGLQYRDIAMADNARWLLKRTPGRVYLWAHNAHVMKAAGAMGRHLADSLGTQYVAIGFMFDSGSFNARPSETEAVTTLKVGQAADSTFEGFFRRFKGMLYFDTHAPNTYALRQFVINPRPMREIGAVYFSDAPGFFLRQTSLYNDFDVMIFVPESAPTRILPYTP